jgi:hypothetical protein
MSFLWELLLLDRRTPLQEGSRVIVGLYKK